MHQSQSGVAADEGLLGLAAQHIGPVFPGAPKSCQVAVVSGIVAVEDAVIGIGQNGQNIADGVKLQLAGLAAGHIQIQTLALQIIVPGHHIIVFLSQLVTAAACVSGHIDIFLSGDFILMGLIIVHTG